MKKKLLIVAAIAFAVFAIPYGSSELSIVSVASENNTVAPSTKPVEEVKNAVDAIDTSKITDVTSANAAAAALTKIGSQDLKEAMNAGQDTVQDVAAIEKAYKNGTINSEVAYTRVKTCIDKINNLDEELNKAGAWFRKIRASK